MNPLYTKSKKLLLYNAFSLIAIPIILFIGWGGKLSMLIVYSLILSYLITFPLGLYTIICSFWYKESGKSKWFHLLFYMVLSCVFVLAMIISSTIK